MSPAPGPLLVGRLSKCPADGMGMWFIDDQEY